MDPCQAKQIEPAAPVWVWDGHWWPAIVADASAKRGGGFLIVRFDTNRRPFPAQLAAALWRIFSPSALTDSIKCGLS
jgi:hypothetical protein